MVIVDPSTIDFFFFDDDPDERFITSKRI